MSQLNDPFRDGMARGWQVLGADVAPVPDEIECDVVVVGTGAGGGVSAELLSRAGLRVVLVEDGPLKTSRDFRQLESEAYPTLYQESAARKTADKAINILQGRSVGGSTTVNWTSSFRTPKETLAHWQTQFGLKDYSPQALAPYFREAEDRLNISAWETPPNENNDLLRRGALKLGIEALAIHRNVKGCWNLGSCGMGCPTNAKQSMLVTTIPAALEQGARLLVQTHADRFDIADGKVQALLCTAWGNSASGDATAARAVRIRARHYVLAAGAINSPAVLLRSGAPDPHGLLGQRTFLHPVVLSASVFEQRVEGWTGAPQTIYSDHYLHTHPIDGPIGFKLEAPPIHPVIFASTVPGFGQAQADLLKKFPHSHVLLALMRDGFHAESAGGAVKLLGSGQPVLDYPLNDFVMEGARRAILAMMELQFAAGAQEVMPVHELAQRYTRWSQAREAVLAMPMKPLLTRVISAHVMGGCGMAADARNGVTRPDGRHWQIDNLSVHDGSLFPTSIGANPQLSIYGIVNRLSQNLLSDLGAQAAALA